jgi:hypothetical protein
MSPGDLMEMLVDSSRVKEYNKLSLGRRDALVLQDDMSSSGGPFGGITKVTKSETKPPLIRKTMQFTSILHAKLLDDDSGYLLVTRSVTDLSQRGQENEKKGMLESEILLSVNIMKKINGQENKCFLTTMNHIKSPMVPLRVAKMIGLQASFNFFNDLRKCC